MESRACYGYYGEGHGASGESKPKKEHASGWSFDDYAFEVKGIGRYFYPKIEVKAKSYENALKAVEKQGRREGFEIVKFIGKNV